MRCTSRIMRVAFLVAALAMVPLGISNGEIARTSVCGASGSCVAEAGSTCEANGQAVYNARYIKL